MLAALAGAFMVSYTAAKPGDGHSRPAGVRRGERAAYLIFGCAFTPVAKTLFANSPSLALHELPIILALTIVAVVANISVVQRLTAVAEALRARDKALPKQPVEFDPEEAIITKRDTPVGQISALGGIRGGPSAKVGRSYRLWEWIRHHTTAVLSTVVDYSVMVALVELGGLNPVPATALGALCGAVTNFTVNRRFTYRAAQVPVGSQLWRFALVSAASLGLNTAGEWLFHDVLGIQYLGARVIASLIVSNGWNYPMLRFFVFSRSTMKDA